MHEGGDFGNCREWSFRVMDVCLGICFVERVVVHLVTNEWGDFRSRSPVDRRMRTQRYSYRGAPYRREPNRGYRHKSSECTTQSLCWNCREPGHMAGSCPNEGICHTCGKAGHRAKDCTAPPVQPGDLRLCHNCYKQGHVAAECTNDKACNNCRKTGHLARECHNDPVCNLCNISGHVARDCPKGGDIDERGYGLPRVGFRDVVCRNCDQVGHMSRDCMTMIICQNCGGRGHSALICPSGRFLDRFPRRY
ncbi:hypothetical protein DM860_003257 [Cuscuta australis]|uniref:CCHC-type domain-containing protein n=2 Tax=Cuscuta sect. Cleistogrammica TaxID=1824901 RepID=A0A328D2U9_9ASTE|nr:hypothetical protein DM860_003257 [Cuscuta australis]